MDPFLALHLQERTPGEFIRMEDSAIYAFESITKETIYDPFISFTMKFEGDVKKLTDQYKSLVIRSLIDDFIIAEAPISVIRQLADSEIVIKMEASLPFC